MLWPATTLGARYFAAKMALPQPPKTSQKVPSASAPSCELMAGVRITSPFPCGPRKAARAPTVAHAGECAWKNLRICLSGERRLPASGPRRRSGRSGRWTLRDSGRREVGESGGEALRDGSRVVLRWSGGGPGWSGGGHRAPETVLQLSHRRTPSALDPAGSSLRSAGFDAQVAKRVN